jgi:hypothetical protein
VRDDRKGKMRASTPLIAAACFTLTMGAAAAAEQKPTAPLSPREQTCYRDAGERQLAGMAREKYLADCLEHGTARPGESCRGRTADAERQKLKGEARRLFMSGCVKRS